MILDRLTLHNYGVYVGRQNIELTPPSRRKPVILIGGLNGGGKTTLLEAIQVVLFGRRSAPAKDFNGKYDDFLADCISRSANAWEGAGLELEFRVRRDAREHTIRVHRSWKRTGKKLAETLEVFEDDALDEVLTDQWAERVEEILPSEVAPLFFFDGERIEQLADLERSADVLRTAVQSLLGLDIVDQLTADLKVLERRHRKKGLNKEDRQELVELEEEFERQQRDHANATLEVGQQQNVVDATAQKVRKVEREFAKLGGRLFEKRKELELARGRALEERSRVDERLRALAAGSAPLLLIRPLLEKVRLHAAQQAESERAEHVANLLERRDGKLLQQLARWEVAKSVLKDLEGYLEADRKEQGAFAGTAPPISLSSETRGRLGSLLESGLEEIRQELKALIGARERIQEAVDEADRALASVPTEESLAAITRKLNEARQEEETAKIRMAAAKEEQRRIAAEVERARSRLSRALERVGLDRLSQEDAARIVLHTSRVRETMKEFRTKVVARHVGRIQGLVLNSFKQLLRKESLVDDLRIDPGTYAVTLLNRDKQAVPSEHLSAGERQLLAVSLLWGLARASGRPLPFVVDTPLGRLDSVHRENLVKRYFPRASHQVVVLSTDEEVDTEQRDRLKSFIGREYTLDFDDKKNLTTIRQGYFS